MDEASLIFDDSYKLVLFKDMLIDNVALNEMDYKINFMDMPLYKKFYEKNSQFSRV